MICHANAVNLIKYITRILKQNILFRFNDEAIAGNLSHGDTDNNYHLSIQFTESFRFNKTKESEKKKR